MASITAMLSYNVFGTESSVVMGFVLKPVKTRMKADSERKIEKVFMVNGLLYAVIFCANTVL
jgi:hypothetical protein